MKKFIIITCIFFFNISIYADDSLLIDATNDTTLQTTFKTISMRLPPKQRQDLSNASAIIMFYGSAMQYSEEKMRELYHKKSAKELITLAQSFCPSTKDPTYKLKSNTKEEFTNSFLIMLMNLSLEDQRQFSEIIAQVMMLAKNNNAKEETFLKELNGLTGTEIIAKFNAVKKSAEATKK